MLISEAQKKRFDEKGFFVLEDIFDGSEINNLTAEIETYVNEANQQLKEAGNKRISRPDEIVFTAFIAEKNEKIQSFVKQDPFVQLTTGLIGPDVRLYWNQAVFKYPETPQEFPWHQDNGYTPLDPEQYYTCWLALSDATLENGCIWVLPESHKLGTQPHERKELGQVGYFGNNPGIAVPLKKGSMAVFSSLLFHRSGPNLTDSIRKAYIIQYIPAHAKNARNNEPFTDRLWVAKDGQRYDG
jgi:ectoine hydroxylase-related dioxygenase (phytanoyl-CoA dioxygenase family)